MIGKIEFNHPCCDTCAEQELTIENEKFYSYDSVYIMRNYISCSHEKVCKKLMEKTEEESSKEPAIRYVGIHEELGILGQ